MERGAREIMLAATELLKNSLDKLATKLDELAAGHSAECQRIHDVLADITARGSETSEFRRDLKNLAQVVIAVRTQPGNAPSLRELPVPPYDLWLPFKAEDLTPSDPEDMVEATRIF